MVWYSKSQFKLTISKSVGENRVRVDSFKDLLMFSFLDISSGALSNVNQFDYLSLYRFVCFIALADRLVLRICPIMGISIVIV